MTNREFAEALHTALLREDPPVPVRALIAGVLMCARGGAPTRLGMAKVGGYSYGSSQNHYGDLLDVLVDRLPEVTEAMAAGDGDPVAAARLRDEVQSRDRTIGELRHDLAAMRDRHENVRRYALALHERLRALDANSTLSEAQILPFPPSP